MGIKRNPVVPDVPVKNTLDLEDIVNICDSKNGFKFSQQTVALYVTNLMNFLLALWYPKMLNKTGAQEIVMPANSRLINVYMEPVSGAPTVKIGSTAGAADYMELQDVGVSNEWGGKRSVAGETVHLTFAGTGTVNITYQLIPNYL
jgi:hypothetical protein